MQLVPDKALNNNFFRGKYELTAVLGVAFYKTWKYKVISDISGLSVLCENYFSGVRTAAVETLSVIYKYFSLSIMLLPASLPHTRVGNFNFYFYFKFDGATIPPQTE